MAAAAAGCAAALTGEVRIGRSPLICRPLVGLVLSCRPPSLVVARVRADVARVCVCLCMCECVLPCAALISFVLFYVHTLLARSSEVFLCAKIILQQ